MRFRAAFSILHFAIIRGLAVLTAIIAVAALLVGIGAFGWQVYHWIGDRAWRPLSVVESLATLGISVQVPLPDSWTLVHRFVEWLPVSATGMVGGTFLLIGASSLRGRAARARARLKAKPPVNTD